MKKFICLTAAVIFVAVFAVSGYGQDPTLTPNEQLGKSIFFDENLSFHPS